jgi:cytochrome b involved in lipid metabolism
MTEILILRDFKKNLTAFIDELIDQFPTEEDLIALRIFFNDQVDIKKVMETITHNLNKDDQKFKEYIKDHNDSFFIDGFTIDYLGEQKTVSVKKIWRSPRLDQEDKQVIWKWIDGFVYLSDKYAKNKTSKETILSPSVS